ncbi:sugar transferase [Staphylospora marina]|uniref:sugar transferase n=1 Tax=Staphylospora marina TaxID=2490858 RepID=UPI000F5BC07A|nr:sugar transferase [Staphylospora marina]
MEMRAERIAGSGMSISRNVTRSRYFRYVKPVLDWTLGMLLLLLVLPVMAIIAVAIKLDSPGPVIFRQPRVGKDGREFCIFKFRTMYRDVPKQGRSPQSSDDPRITRVGRFLRRTSLDELPQLINIIRGEMSLVGPRPEQKMIVEQYYTDYEKQRFLVKPGITGPWQLSGDRTRPIHENLHYDFEYIETASFMKDLYLILSTVKVMFRSNTC